MYAGSVLVRGSDALVNLYDSRPSGIDPVCMECRKTFKATYYHRCFDCFKTVCNKCHLVIKKLDTLHPYCYVCLLVNGWTRTRILEQRLRDEAAVTNKDFNESMCVIL